MMYKRKEKTAETVNASKVLGAHTCYPSINSL